MFRRQYRVTWGCSLLARHFQLIMHHAGDAEDSLKQKLIEDV